MKIGPDMVESVAIQKGKRAKPYLSLVPLHGGLNSLICHTHAVQ